MLISHFSAGLPTIFPLAGRRRLAASATLAWSTRGCLFRLLPRRTISHVQILNSSTRYSSPVVVVSAGHQRYLFNCPEGVQRILFERNVRLGKIRDVFLTSLDVENHLGLPGLLLIRSDCARGYKNCKPKRVTGNHIKVHGPRNTTHLLAALEHLVSRDEIRVTTAEYPHDATYHSDQCLTVYPVLLYPEGYQPPSTAEESRGCQELETTDSILAHKREILSKVFSGSPWFETRKFVAFRRELRQLSEAFASKTLLAASRDESFHDDDVDVAAKLETEGSDNNMGKAAADVETSPSQKVHLVSRMPEVMCYICHRPCVPGLFNVEAAEALGVADWAYRNKLSIGESVINSDGQEVHPHQVLGPPKFGQCFIIVKVPSVNYITSLVQSRKFRKYYRGRGPVTPDVVVHLLGEGVLEDSRYREWARMFDDSVQHIFSSRSVCPDGITFRASAFNMLKMSAIDNKIFPVPYYNNKSEIDLDSYEGLPPKSTLAAPMLRYILERNPRLDWSEVPEVFDHRSPDSSFVRRLSEMTEYNEVVAEMKRMEGKIEERAGNKREENSDRVDVQSYPGEDIVVTTLGTGSCQPSTNRNVSGTLIRIPGKGSILLDCGEATCIPTTMQGLPA